MQGGALTGTAAVAGAIGTVSVVGGLRTLVLLSGGEVVLLLALGRLLAFAATLLRQPLRPLNTAPLPPQQRQPPPALALLEAFVPLRRQKEPPPPPPPASSRPRLRPRPPQLQKGGVPGAHPRLQGDLPPGYARR